MFHLGPGPWWFTAPAWRPAIGYGFDSVAGSGGRRSCGVLSPRGYRLTLAGAIGFHQLWSADTVPDGMQVIAATATRIQEALAELLQQAIDGEAGVFAVVFRPAALVIGSAQRDLDLYGIDVVRRGSGGGAVLCTRDLLEVDVALPREHPLLLADVSESYRFFGEAWAEALRSLGAECRMVDVAEARALTEERQTAAREACYAGLSPYEVVTADGRKLVGLSQRRRGGAALFQSSVYCSTSPAAVAAYLPSSVAAHLTRTASLQALGVDTDPDRVWAAVEASVRRRLDRGAPLPNRSISEPPDRPSP
jgi:lipoate-protein ligase A